MKTARDSAIDLARKVLDKPHWANADTARILARALLRLVVGEVR